MARPGAERLADIIAQQIENAVDEKVAKIDNAALKKAIRESLLDAVYEKLEQDFSGPISKLVDESMDDITRLLGKKTPKRPSTGLTKSFASSGSGGKDSDYGGKDSTPVRRAPAPRPSYGGKDSGYGGK